MPVDPDVQKELDDLRAAIQVLDRRIIQADELRIDSISKVEKELETQNQRFKDLERMQAGYIAVGTAAGTECVSLSATPSGAGLIQVQTRAGKPAVVLDTVARIDDQGSVHDDGSVHILSDNEEVVTLGSSGIFTKGSVSAGSIKTGGGVSAGSISTGNIWCGNLYSSESKSFVMTHPKDPSKDIVYSCLEGPEAAAYIRGRAALTNGRAQVDFPEHFLLVINPDTVTILLTPRSATSKGLAMVESGPDGFTVRELFDGTGSYDFDYFVSGIRKGYEDYQPVRTGINGRPQRETRALEPGA